MTPFRLPILDIRDDLSRHLSATNAIVINAPTGSGKSTQIPQMLLESGLVQGRILVLQPRRLAARMLAQRISDERHMPLGTETGFQTRYERVMSRHTRIAFLTEGLLLRMLLADRQLGGVSVVVFDEFHERNLAGDIGLGMVRSIQAVGRPDLKLVVMSATIEASKIAEYLDDCPCLQAFGHIFPVDLTYLKHPLKQPVWEAAAGALGELLRDTSDGDVLIFMPGAYEIRKTCEACHRTPTSEKLLVLSLHGDMPPERQRSVMMPDQRRKVIVATNLAETSLTIPGIRHVIDSGLAKTSRYDPTRGFNMLVTEPISRSSAEQRAGRAGREGPGRCYRLWSEAEQQRRPAQADPEIKRVDLAEAVLSLKSLGFDELEMFPWLEPPQEGRLDSAVRLLERLGILGRRHLVLTTLGREIGHVAAHPRLALLMREADHHGFFEEAALIAAVLSERPIVASTKIAVQSFGRSIPNTLGKGMADVDPAPPQSDLFAVINALRIAREKRFDMDWCKNVGIHGTAAQTVWRACDSLIGQGRRDGMGKKRSSVRPDELVKCVLRAFPDRLARRLDKGTLRCELSNGRRANLARESTLQDIPLMVAAEVREVGRQGRNAGAVLSLASEVRREWLVECFPDDWEEVDDTYWDDKAKQVLRRRRMTCLGLVLEEFRDVDVDARKAVEILVAKIKDGTLKLRGWTADVDRWQDRVRWVAERFPERNLIRYDETDLDVIYHELCDGATGYKQVGDKPCIDLVRNMLSWEDQCFVQKMAPERFQLPSGRRMRLDYQPGHPVRGKAPIQDLYDVKETPRVAGGREKVLLEILAPNMRTVQVTNDLEGFWEQHYPTVKQELCKRYPKHEWR